MPTIELEDDDEGQEQEPEDDDDGLGGESSSESEDEDEGDGDELLLGFLELPVHPELMLRHHFPCKVGGKPAWLNPLCVPPLSALSCVRCKRPLKFLLQVNACLEFDDAFHRSLMLFICPNQKCLAEGCFVALRSQLPRVNPFYPFQPTPDPLPWEGAPVELDEEPLASSPHLCAVCGLPGPKSCGQCRKVHYCSQEHQRLHWKPIHSSLCARTIQTSSISTTTTTLTSSSDSSIPSESASVSASESGALSPTLAPSPDSNPSTSSTSQISTGETPSVVVSEVRTADTTSTPAGETKNSTDDEVKITITSSRFRMRPNLGVLYPEREIVIEPDSEEVKEEVVRKPIIEDDDATFDSRSWKKLNKNPLSKQFQLFQATISKAPEQVIRYQRGGKCLWVSAENQVTSVPPCPMCQGPRVFEFQVLPQLLYYLGETASSLEDSQSALDWGTLAVYTCEKSCGDGLTGYFPEFVHLQPHEQ